MMIRALAVGAALLAATACTELPDIARDTCGNNVLEAGEDCDGVPAFEGATCAPADEVNACFYTCEAAPDCPVGWGCGADGRCRQATPRLTRAPGSPWRFKVQSFAIGDIDGDGHADLVGNNESSIVIRFGTDTGEFPVDSNVSTRTPQGTPQFRDFDGDGLLDVVIPIFSGIFTLLGQSNRTMLPVAYAPLNLDTLLEEAGAPAGTVIRLVPAESDPLTLDTELVVIVAQQMFIADGGAGLPLAQSIAMHVGRIPVAFADACASCDPAVADTRQDWLLAFNEDTAVRAYTTEGVGPTLRPVLRQTIALAAGHEVRRGAQFGDVNGDGYLDVLVGTRGAASEDRVCVAYYREATDDFASPCVVETVFTTAVGGRDPLGWPLAAGDFNRDGKADYVGSDGIYIADLGAPGVGPPGRLDPTAFNTHVQNPWVDAALGDFNGDGELDAAVSIEGTEGIDFYMGSGFGLFNKFHVDTDDPPTFLRAGDFDGDFVHDVAFVLAGGLFDTDGLAVAFGDVGGGPSDPVFMGELERIEQLEPLFQITDEESFDLIVDLMVLSNDFEGSSGRSLAVLQGSSERRMISPFTLADSANPDDIQTPLRVAVGQFAAIDNGAGDTGDVVAVGGSAVAGDVRTSLWLIPGDGPGGALSSADTKRLDLPALDMFDATCADWVAGDLDGDGTDEVVAIDHLAGCPGVGSAFSLSPSLVVLSSASIGTTGGFEPATVEGFVGPKRMQPADLDGDGDLDLLVVFGGEEEGEPARGEPAARSGVVVFWNDGDGLALDGPSSFRVPIFHLLDAAPINLDGDPELEIVALATEVTDGGVFFSDLDPATKAYGAPQRLVRQTANGRLAVGDVNGDGVDDVAWTEGIDVQVFLGVPAPPLGDPRDAAQPTQEDAP